ncbi:MAG: gliding motility-associated C-terminal domain-containing protein, partial [Cyclobacteriaceae bacterium]|nr:gliding motility-associated C-terminal domain-containing protein [Cyclobacteriaceae bacterium]
VAAGQTKTICSGQAVNHPITLSPAGLPAGTLFTWPDPDGAGPATARAVPSTAQIGDVLTNTSGADITVTYQVTPVGPGGALGSCTGATVPIVITVRPAPVIVPAQVKTICSGSPVNLEILMSPLNLPAGTVFNWPVPTVSGGPAQGSAGLNVAMGGPGTNHITEVLTNTTGAPITVTYNVTPSAAGCSGTMQPIVITVNPAPVIPAGQTKAICSGQAVGLEVLLSPANAPAGTVFNWPVPTMSAGAPQGTFGNNVPMGAAGTIHINDVLVNNTGAPITATYAITPTSGAGCLGATSNVVVTINPLPVANPIGGPGTVCVSPTNIILYQVTPNAGSTFTWTIPPQFTVFGGGGTNSPNFFVLLSFPTVGAALPISVVETNVYGCVGTANTLPITVAPAPGALTINGPTVVCKNQTGVNFSVPAGIFNPTSTYNWSASGATIVSASSGVGLQTITVDFGLLASADITLNEVSASGCSGTPVTLNVAAADRPVMTSSSTNTICSGNTPSLVFTTNPLVPSTFNWTVINITGGVTGTLVGNSGTGNISEVLSNTSGFSGTVTYRVTPVAIAAPNCTGAPQDVVVTVNPEPVLVTPQTKTICSGASTSYEILLSPLTFPAGTTFTWPAPVMSAGPAQGTPSPGPVTGGPAGTIHINDVLTNTTNAPITATYTITPTSGAGCVGTARTVVITVNPQPVISSTLDATHCSDAVTGLTLSVTGTSVAAATYNITARSISAGLTPSGSNAFVPANGVAANYLAADAFTNTTAGPLTVTYTVVGVSASGCVGAPMVITQTINPEPVVSTLLDAALCSDQATGLTLNTNGTSVAAANYNITARTIAPGLTAAVGNAIVPANGVVAGYLAADVFINNGASPLTVVYTVVPVSAAGCAGDPRNITITINPEPVVSPTLNASVCSDVATGLTLATNGASVSAATYNITARTIDPGLTPAGTNVAVPANGVTAAYLATDRFTNTGAGALPVTYTVVPISPSGCQGDPVVITITVNPEPVVSTLLNTTVCSDVTTGLILNTNGTSVAAATYNITARTIQAGLTPGGSNALVTATGVAANYLANDLFVNNGAVPLTVTYTVVPVSATGCTGDPQVITVTIRPEPVVAATLDATVCSDVAIGLTLNTNGSSIAAASYNVTARAIAAGLTAGGANVPVPGLGVAAGYLANDVYTNTGAVPLTVTYTVAGVSADGCLGDSRVITMIINPEPVVSTTLNTTVCSDIATNLVLNTNGTSVAAFNYNIVSRNIAGGLTAAGTNAVVPANGVAANYLASDRFTNTGNAPLTVTYTVEATSAAGCLGNQQVITVTINPEPVVSNTLDLTQCSNVPIGLVLGTNGTSEPAINYNIMSQTTSVGLVAAGGNVAVPAMGVAANYLSNHTFANSTSLSLTVQYVVVPVSASGCLGDAKTITVTIDAGPIVANNLDATVCSDAGVGLTLAVDASSAPAANYNITARTIAPGLVAGGGNAVVPFNNAPANYLAADTYTNTGSLPLTVTYTVVGVGVSGCLGNPRVITMTINPEPVVATTLNATVCSDAVIGLNLATNGTSVAALDYDIVSRTIAPGLVAAGSNVAVPASGVGSNYLALDRFTNTGAVALTVTYSVRARSAAGCLGDVQVVTITINPEPVVANTLNGTVCSDSPTGLVLNTNGSSVAAANYNITGITIAAGLSAAGGNAVVPANGVGVNYLSGDIFTNTGALPLTVVYTVVPVSAAGCLGDPQAITMTINPEPVVSPSLDATLCSDIATGLTLNTNGSSVAAATYNITSSTVAGALVAGGGNAAVPAFGVAAGYLASDVFTNTTSGSLQVTYTVVPVSAAGCVGNSRVITLTIQPEPVVSSLLDATVCSDAAVGLTLNTSGTSVIAASYNVTARTIDPGLVAAGTNVAVPANGVAANYLSADRFTNTGAVPLSLTYTVAGISAAGCVGNPQVITITINPEPVVSNTLDLTQCSDVATGLTLATNGTSVAASSWNITARSVSAGLTIGAGNAVITANGVAANYLAADTYTNTGSTPLTVTYTVVPVSASGCTGDSKVITVTINPEPVVSTTLDATVCSDLAVGLTLNTNGSSVAAATYNVSAIAIAPGLVANGGNAVVPAAGVASNYLANDVFTNPTAAPLTVVYTVAGVSAAGCLGNTRTITMTINPEPVISPALDATVCSDVAIGLTLNTDGVSVAASNYNIVSRTIAGGLVPAGTNAPVPATGVGNNYLASDRFTNTGAVPLTVTYTVLATSAAGCVGDTRVITITIAPEPVASNALNLTQCSDTATGLTLNTNGVSVAAATYNITSVTISGGLTAAGTNAVIPATGVAANYLAGDMFTNTGNVSRTASYVIVPVSAAGCLGDPMTVVVTINPEPVVSAGLNATICSDLPIALTLNTNGVSVAASTYNITAQSIAAGLVPAGANAVVPAAGVGAGYLAGDVFTNTTNASLTVTYTVVGVSADGCVGDPRVITMTISPEPIVSTTLNATVCSDVATGLTLNTTGASVAASSYNVTGVVLAPGLTAAGTNAVVPANGVTAGYLALDQFSNPTNAPLTVDYTVVGVSASGCVGNPQVITITIAPEPVVSASLNLTQCSDVAIGLVLNTEATSVAAANYNITARNISAGLTAAGSNAVVTANGVAANYLSGDQFTNTGATPLTVTYTVVPISAAGCVGDPRVITVTINPEPVVSASLNATVCSDNAIGLTLNTNGTSVAAASYNITSRTIAAGLVAAGTNAAVPAAAVANNYLASDAFTNPTNGALTVSYTVVPVSAAGCLGDPRVITMTINPEPVLSPSLDATRCSDQAISLTLATNGVSVAAANYNITSRTIAAGLVPAGTNVVVPATGVAANYLLNDRFTNTGAVPLTVTYTVVPVSGTGCLGDAVVVTMTIDPEPVVANGLDATVCSDIAIGLTLNTNGTSVAAGTYNITNRTISAGLLAGGTNGVVPATGVADNYLAADFYTNTTAAPLTVTYTVVPVSAAGCLGDAKVITLTIQPEPVVATGLDAAKCSDVAIGLTLATTGTSAPAANYNITAINVSAGLVPGGSNAAVPANGVAPIYLANDVFTNPTLVPLTVQYTVVPVSATGCLGDASIITITIGAEPVGANDVKTICSDQAVTYNLQNNINTLGNGFSSNFSWVAAPNGSVTGESTVAQAGPIITDVLNNVTNVDQVVVYTVTPTGTNGCPGNPFTISVTVQPEPMGANQSVNINSDIILNYDLQNNVNTVGNNLAATFSWVASINSNVGGESTTPQTGALITDVLNNVTNSNQTVTYTVIPTSLAGCAGNPFIITVTVLPEPVGVNDALTINSDVANNYSLQNNVNSVGNGVPATFVWVAVDNPLVTGESTAPQAGGTLNDVINNVTGVDQVVVYTVTPTGTNGVVGDPFTITVTIRSEPVGANDTKTVCSDIAVGYDLQNNLNTFGNGQLATFSWFAAPNPNVTGESTTPQTGALINDLLNNVTSANEVVVYTVTPTGTNGCPGNTFQISITVQPEPVVATTLNETKCSGEVYGKLLATNGVSIGAASYNVTVVSKDAGITGGRPLGLIGGGGSAANVIQNDSYINTTATPQKVVYSVVPNGTNGCIGDALLVEFTINPEPVLSNPGFPAICSSNTSGNSITNIVLGTDGVSVGAATYQLLQIQYSNGGPFGVALPAGFSAAGGNTLIGAVGSIDLVRNDRYTNTSAVPVTVRYTIQATSASGCLSDPLDYDVTVNPEPTLDPLLNPTPVCSGLPSGVTLGVAAGSVAAVSYNINSILFPGLTAGGANTGIGNNKPANAIFNDVYVNTTSGVLTATYKIAPVTAAGCVGPEGTVTLTINPSPDLANTLNRIVCTNTASGIVFSTTAASVAAASYNLISVTPQAGLTPAGGNAAFPANAVGTGYVNADQFTNTTNAPLTVTYRVAPVSAAGCIGPQEDIILTVEPVPAAAPINLKPTVCSGSSNGTDLTDIELISPTNPSAGVITFNYTAVSSIGTQITGFVPALSGLAENYKITDNLVNTSNAAATVTYTITPIAAGASSGIGCAGTPAIVVVTVEPKPKLVAASLKTVCEGVATAISLTSPTTPSAGTVEFLLVSAVATGGVTGASANGTVFANGATLNDLLSNPTTTAQTVTYTFRPRFNGGAGCVGDDVVSVVTVNPRPTVVPSPQAQICSGDVVDITLTTDVATTVSTWTVSAPATITGESAGAGDRIFQILFNSGNNIETVTYTVTPQAAGCAGTPVAINVTVNPKAQVIGVPATTTICHGSTLNIPLTSNVGIGVTYAWTVDDPSGLGVPATGSGNVINQPMSNTLGFQATLTYTITPTGPGPGAGCVGDSKIMIVTVSPEITASWLNTPSPDFICKGSTEYLVINIGGRAPFNFTYNDGGAPIVKTNQPPVAVLPHVPAVTTTYTLTSVTDGLGCTTAFNVPFVVNVGDTDPNFSIITPTAACSPNVVSFQYNQVAGTIYTWRFGDSADSVYQATTTVANRVIKHTYTNLSPSSTLNYPVTLQTELPAPFPGCFKSNPAQTVTIYPNPILNVLPNRTEICSGESITFTNSSVGTTASTISWSYRVQGQTAETAMGTTFNMTYAFTNTTTSNPIIYEVIFRASNAQGCPVPEVIMPIQVYRYSVAGFNEGTVPDFVNGESLVTFTNTSTILDAAAFNYSWVFGADAQPANSTSMSPATVRYVSPGPKEITLTVTNNARSQCQTTFTKQINIVLPPLIATFDVNPKESCFPAKISVDTNPAVTQITGDIIEWTVVDENNRVVATSSGVFPEFNLQSEGEYRVKLRTSSSQTGQTATAPDVTVTVYGKPIASFDARPDIVFVPDTEMQIFNFSDNPDKLQFVWDFGDGDVLSSPPAPSNDQAVPPGTHNDRTKGTYEEPIHIYKVEGIYEVTMFVNYDHGNNVVCRDTVKHQVQARQGGITKVPNAFTPSTTGPSGGQSGNGTFNDVFLPIVKGADEYNLQIYDRWGNLIFESNSSQIGWDGYSADGKLLPAGVYVYKLTVRLSDGQRSTQIGDVTMIR